jgi:hypothetical protein
LTGRVFSIEEGKIEAEEPDDKLGELLAQRFPLFYSKLHSPTEKKKVWCNFCVHCDARQGNYYLHVEWYKDRIEHFSGSIQRVLEAGLCSEEEAIEFATDPIEPVHEKIIDEKPLLMQSRVSKDDVAFCPKCNNLQHEQAVSGCAYTGHPRFLRAPARLTKKDSLMGRDIRKETRYRSSIWDEPGPRL